MGLEGRFWIHLDQPGPPPWTTVLVENNEKNDKICKVVQVDPAFCQTSIRRIFDLLLYLVI